MQSSKRGMWKRYQLSIEGIQKDTFCVKKKGIKKGNGLDLGVEPHSARVDLTR